MLIKSADVIIGPHRTECLVDLYKSAHQLNIPIISFSTISSLLFDQKLYPNIFSTCPSDSHQAKAIAKIVERFAWKMIGIAFEEGGFYGEFAEKVEVELQLLGIRVSIKQGFHKIKVDEIVTRVSF